MSGVKGGIKGREVELAGIWKRMDFEKTDFFFLSFWCGYTGLPGLSLGKWWNADCSTADPVLIQPRKCPSIPSLADLQKKKKSTNFCFLGQGQPTASLLVPHCFLSTCGVGSLDYMQNK